jgi:hypothetical protein
MNEEWSPVLSGTRATEYIGFIFDYDIDCTALHIGMWATRCRATVVQLASAQQILHFCNTANAAANAGELTGDQFNLFCNEFISSYSGMKHVVFVPKRLVSPDNGLKSKLLREKVAKLLSKECTAAGRQKAIDAIIDRANEIRTLDDCGHKNVVKQVPAWQPPTAESPVAPATSSTADCPPQMQAAIRKKSEGVPSIINAYNESIKAPKIANVHDETNNEIHNTLKEVKSILQNPLPVYQVDKPKGGTLKPEDCPVDGKGGFWEEQEKYATRVGIKPDSLTSYRKTSLGARWSSDETWGETKRGGHKFKPVDPSKTNSPCLWWVVDK